MVGKEAIEPDRLTPQQPLHTTAQMITRPARSTGEELDHAAGQPVRRARPGHCRDEILPGQRPLGDVPPHTTRPARRSVTPGDQL